jgi:hypothetical protein
MNHATKIEVADVPTINMARILSLNNIFCNFLFKLKQITDTFGTHTHKKEFLFAFFHLALKNGSSHTYRTNKLIKLF